MFSSKKLFRIAWYAALRGKQEIVQKISAALDALCNLDCTAPAFEKAEIVLHKSEEYFSDIVGPYMANSCDVIADSIIEAFSLQIVVDVGCGTGLLLCAMKEKGVRQCLGIDRSQASLDICKERGLDVIKVDLERGTMFV
ncbi:MAG: class I SAM-dependent methyltransferase [Desulfobacteraceae bacterium]|nr:class I SAM-dependent methyltransferase [Desulfobacteraceae bacterium]